MRGKSEQIHVVEAGDTLYSLGKKYNVTAAAILYANPWVDVYQLRQGDEILIPRKDIPKRPL